MAYRLSETQATDHRGQQRAWPGHPEQELGAEEDPEGPLSAIGDC